MANLTEILNSDLTSERVEKKGQWFYKRSKPLILIGICGMILLLIFCIIGYMDIGVRTLLEVLTLQYGEAMSALTLVCYIAILCGCVGIGWYFYGIQTFALGRIAVNTEKEQSVFVTHMPGVALQKEKTPNVLPKENLAPDQKRCWACGTVQKASNRFCVNCNESI
jgi:hypothetical protein